MPARMNLAEAQTSVTDVIALRGDHDGTSNQTSPPSTTSAMNQQKISAASSINKTFYIFTTEVPGFRETEGVKEAGLPSDQFSLQTILVRVGDQVTVHFYNLDTTDRHTFTIDGPYDINIDTAPGLNATANFVADHVGIFKFYCKYHLPSMAGQLEVLS